MGEAKEACGLYGIWQAPDALERLYYGLYALQHRGQESVGVVAVQGGKLVTLKGMGLVGEVLSPEKLASLGGASAIGHVRYSTTGGSEAVNIQPLVANCLRGWVAVAHNGNLTNGPALRRQCEEQGSIFQTTTDSEVILHLLARPSSAPFLAHLAHVLSQLQGAFSLLFLTPEGMIAARDPLGLRPLSLGKTGDSWVVASETAALRMTGAAVVRDLKPGEIFQVSTRGCDSFLYPPPPLPTPQHCIFEHIYFARPDSVLYGDNVHLVRKALGRQLAREHPVEADLVMPIPDSGNSAALGYAEASGLPFEMGMVRNHYVGRTFIRPSPSSRQNTVRIKLSVVPEVVAGRRVVVVDDSVIRGTTSRARIQMLREAGAKEVHLRISCPPHRHPCFYGIDFPTNTELIASLKTPEEIASFIGGDSLGYLSVEGMLSAVSLPPDHYCLACFNGRYPVPISVPLHKHMFER